jgi:hypothetical protein
MNQFVFKKIHRDTPVAEAAAQLDQLYRLSIDPDTGMFDPERDLDALRVCEALGTGRMPSRAEVRKRVQANEAKYAHETLEQSRDRYEALLQSQMSKPS